MEYRNLPDLNGWATLRAVIEKGGVQAAAEVLHVGQPAITKRLRALEANYGMTLLEKSGNRLKLTPAGEKVYRLAVDVLDRQLALRSELLAMLQGQYSIRLEATFTIGERLLPDILLQFSALYPDYKIETRMAYGRTIQSHLAAGLADIALMEAAPSHSGLQIMRWREDELWLVCSAQHPLSHVETIRLQDLSQLSFVLRESRSSSRESLEHALQTWACNQLNVVLEVGSTDTIIEIISRGKHFSFLPKFSVQEKVLQGQLHLIKIRDCFIRHTLWMVYCRSVTKNPVVRAFIETLQGVSMCANF